MCRPVDFPPYDESRILADHFVKGSGDFMKHYPVRMFHCQRERDKPNVGVAGGDNGECRGDTLTGHDPIAPIASTNCLNNGARRLPVGCHGRIRDRDTQIPPGKDILY